MTAVETAKPPTLAEQLAHVRAQLATAEADRDRWRKAATDAQAMLGHNRRATNMAGQQVMVLRLRLNRVAELAVAVANGADPYARERLFAYLKKCHFPEPAFTNPLHERSKK
jgi:hypothetical protein